MKIPDASVGKNWVIAVLSCPAAKLPGVLNAMMVTMNQISDAHYPHYTIREHEAKKRLKVSFRVLVPSERHEHITQVLLDLASEYKISIKIPGKAEYRAWLKKNSRIEEWTQERCLILHHLSMAAVACLKEGLPGPRLASWDLSRRNFAHLFVNMLALREGFVDLAMVPEKKR